MKIFEFIKSVFSKKTNRDIVGKTELKVYGISYTQNQFGTIYILLLSDNNGEKKVPLIVNFLEAQSIMSEVEKVKVDVPIIHDVVKNILTTGNIKIKELFIDEMEKGEIFSKLIFSNYKKTKIKIKPSDGISLSIRMKFPIFIENQLLSKINTFLNQNFEIKKIDSGEIINKDTFNGYTTEDLKNLLQSFVEKEEYEKALLVRDEISKRKLEENLNQS